MKKGINKFLLYSALIHFVLISVLLLSLVGLGFLSINEKKNSDLTHISLYKNPATPNSIDSFNNLPAKNTDQPDNQLKQIKRMEQVVTLSDVTESTNSKNQYKFTEKDSKISIESNNENKNLLQQENGNKIKKEILKGRNENIEAESVKSIAIPEYSANPKPKYPLVARQRGYEGEVVFNVHVLSDGNVGELKIVKTSGYSVLDNSAHAALKKWKFVPGKLNGKTISSWVKVPILFRLNTI